MNNTLPSPRQYRSCLPTIWLSVSSQTYNIGGLSHTIPSSQVVDHLQAQGSLSATVVCIQYSQHAASNHRFGNKSMLETVMLVGIEDDGDLRSGR